MVLYELIAFLEKFDPEKAVPIGFDNPHSYRGYYDQLAFEPVRNTTVGEMLAAARSARGATYNGWKGGEYTMTDHTEVWLAMEGDCGEGFGPVLLSLMLGVEPDKELLG